MKKTIKKSIISWLIFSLTVVGIFITYAATWITATSSEILTVSKWNNMISSLTTPTWAIMAFNLTNCPDWWITADWINSGTPDLRWAFVRWIWWDANSRDVARALWDYQTDMFASHSHKYENNKSWHWLREWTLDRNTYEKPRKTYTNYDTTSTWWTETRPKNIALLYCMKQ